MEIPHTLKNLYHHWEEHTRPDRVTLNPHDISEDLALFDDVRWFIGERIHIWKKKTAGAPRPYTTDPILDTYRFCNIFREFDRQTIEFHELLLDIRDDFPLWLLNMFYCRMVARTETIRAVGLLSYDKKQNAAVYERLLVSPRPRFGTPYVFPVSTIQRSATPTRELFIANHLPKTVEPIAQMIQHWQKHPVYQGVEEILSLFEYNLRFLWTEVLIDVAYQFPEHIDLFAQFPVGPGSLPTLLRLAPNEEPSRTVERLTHVPVDTGLTVNGKRLRLSAENWEGIGCEFRKYTNLEKGIGRKRLYKI